MRYAIMAKFRSHPDLAKELVATFPYILVEGNSWGDKFWGRDTTTHIGHNFLGLVLMEVRARLHLEVAWERRDKQVIDEW